MVDMVIRDLWQADGLQVWSPQRSADLRRSLGDAGRAEVVASARAAGAGTVIVGRLEKDPTGVVVRADLLDTRDGRVRATVRSVATGLEEIPSSADQLRDQIWDSLGVSPPAGVQPITALMTTDLRAYGQFMAGQMLYFEGKFLAATDHFAEASRADRDFALAHYRRATATLQYVPVGSSDVQSYLTLAWGKRQHATERDARTIEGLRAMIFDQAEDAARVFEEVRERWPGDKEIAYFHALVLEQLGRPTEAADAFDAAVRFDPEFVQAWEGLAGAAFVTGQRQRSARAVESGLRINAAAPRLLEARVNLLLFDADLDRAREALDDALRQRQERNLLLSRAKLVLLEGDAAGALEQAVTVRSPLLAATAEIYRGQVRAGLSRLVATTDLQVASANRFNAAVGKWFTGMVLERNGDTASAVEQFTGAANLSVRFLDSREALGVSYARRGELKKAETIAGGIRELGPNLREPGWERHALRVEATLALAREEWDEAIRLLEQAYELSGVRFLAGGFVSDRPLYAEALALAYVQKGDLRSAEPLFTEIVEMAGDRLFWPWIWLGAQVQLAELAVRDNRSAEAERPAEVVRRFWGDAGGQNQPLVDGYLDRLDRIVPIAP